MTTLRLILRQAALATLTLVMGAALAQQKPTTGYASVNGVKMYYEVRRSGEPVVLLHGAFMAITNNWEGWISELSKTRKVIAIELQGYVRTADVPRDITYANLANDVGALLDHLKIPRADLIGYSMGGEVAMQCGIRHPTVCMVTPQRRTESYTAQVILSIGPVVPPQRKEL